MFKLSRLKKGLLIAVLCTAIGGLSQYYLPVNLIETAFGNTDQIIQKAYDNHQSDVQVSGAGIVVKTLADDLQGSRHQRFILKLTTGQTLLITHNIDLAPRINGLRVGDRVEFYGEYEWNRKGGVIHWTHDDPNKRHTGGWLKHKGMTYQ